MIEIIRAACSTIPTVELTFLFLYTHLYSKSQAVITALGEARQGACSKLHGEADNTVGKNRVSIVWTRKHLSVTQNELADVLIRRGQGPNPTGPEPILPPFLSRYMSKIKNWIAGSKHVKWKTWECIRLVRYVWEYLLLTRQANVRYSVF